MAKVDAEILIKIELSISKVLFMIVLLLTLSTVIPIFAWYGVFQQDNNVSIWFQRSGSLTVLFAVWAEYKLFNVHKLTSPMSEGGGTWQDLAHKGALQTKYKQILYVINFMSVTLVIVGTVIWGYGDLFKGA